MLAHTRFPRYVLNRERHCLERPVSFEVDDYNGT